VTYTSTLNTLHIANKQYGILKIKKTAVATSKDFVISASEIIPSTG